MPEASDRVECDSRWKRSHRQVGEALSASAPVDPDDPGRRGGDEGVEVVSPERAARCREATVASKRDVGLAGRGHVAVRSARERRRPASPPVQEEPGLRRDHEAPVRPGADDVDDAGKDLDRPPADLRLALRGGAGREGEEDGGAEPGEDEGRSDATDMEPR